ncbi:hypothetical protein Plhal304r1_c003g0012671 [Plasmopara halstedii]
MCARAFSASSNEHPLLSLFHTSPRAEKKESGPEADVILLFGVVGEVSTWKYVQSDQLSLDQTHMTKGPKPFLDTESQRI